MIGLVISNWRLILIGLLLAVVAVQELRVRLIKVDFQTYRAEIERQVAENKVRNAQEAARQALNAKESLDALQGRYAALSRSYKRLRDSASPDRVPALSSAASVLSSCPGNDGKSDTASGFLAEVESRVAEVIQRGDEELAKYVQLWELQKKNANSPK